MSDDSVKVAVRVRPFNAREQERQAKLIIDMQGAMTAIANPETPGEEPKKFTFDFSYWSHDGYQEDASGLLVPALAQPSKYASQQMVFEDLGQGVLQNAFDGYNCSLFAYGQTGSGKSYSMVGYGKNRGIVPITCDKLFKRMSDNKDKTMHYEVTFSMLEIYNEQVRDLLSKENPKGGLQVHQNPKLGIFYVEGLKHIPVGSYSEIEKRMEQGTANRTVASTNMNATSSRAHTVVSITFDQISKDAGSGEEKKRSSVMNLVDLAGSERADSTGATGDRLKEGANINKSLSALGNVISALAELSGGSKKKIVVPYRDSVLTKLLQNALGGNSKTIMIAALSPADINYDETLSTLRYADRAKKIKNKAVINENPIDKMIRELKEENEKLKKAMQGGLLQTTAGMAPEEIAQMRKQMEEEIRAQLDVNVAMMTNTQRSWEDRLREARKETIGEGQGENAVRKDKEPHIVNLNEDPMLSGVIYHFFKIGDETTIGRKEGSYVPDIALSGLSIMKEHAVVTCAQTQVDIRPGQNGAKTKINGQPLTGTQVLQHQDRIQFGSNNLYVFVNPLKNDCAADLPKVITYEFAQKEIAQAKGFATSSSTGLTKEQQLIQDQVLEILPMVSEVNAMSEEMNKYRSFEVVLISSAAGAAYSTKTGTSVMVKMKNLLSGNTWLWERGKFMNRRYIMQELYQRWQNDDLAAESLDPSDDPFWEPTDDILVGTTNMYLSFLCFPMDFDYRAPVKDYGGHDEGVIDLCIAPCTASGKPVDPDLVASDQQEPADAALELLQKPFHFKVCVVSALVENPRFAKGLKVKYKVLNDSEHTETSMVAGTCQPVFNHERVVSIECVTQEWIEYFLNGCIVFELYAKQQDNNGDTKFAKMSTRELRNMDHVREASLVRRQSTIHAMHLDDADSASKNKSNYAVMEKKYERLLQKEKRLQQLCSEWKSKRSSEQQFEPFFRAVSAVAHSNGIQLKTRAQLITKILSRQKDSKEQDPDDITTFLRTKYADAKDEDVVSLVYFGEDEQQVRSKVLKNGGHAPIDLLMLQYGGGGNADRKTKDLSWEQAADDDQQSKSASQVCAIT